MNNKKHFSFLLVLFIITFFSIGFFAFNTKTAEALSQWSIGFHTPWGGSSPVADIDWAALTHVVQVGAVPNSNGILTDISNGDTSALIAAAHSHNVKVLLNIQPSSNMAGAVTNNLSALVSNIMTKVNDNGYDGVDVDWEIGWNDALAVQFFSAMRTALGSSKVLVLDALIYQSPSWMKVVEPYVDRINIMTYDIAAPAFDASSWFDGALYGGPSNISNVDKAVSVYLGEGIPAGKLGIGLPFYGYHSSGGTPQITGPRQTFGSVKPSWTQMTYKEILAAYNISSPTWDAPAHNPWIQTTDGWLTFQNAQSVTDRVQYVKDKGLGGWIIWTIDGDYQSSGNPKHPLLAAVKNAMGGVTPDTIAPSIPTNLSTTVVSPSAINLSWTASTDNVGVIGYKIFRGGTQVGTSATNSYSDTSLTSSTNYSYTVSAYDAAGNNSPQSSSVSATTQASVPSIPTISSFTASPTTITSGQSSTLSWNVTGATSLSINQGVGIVTGTSKLVSPTVTTTYILTATNSGGSVTSSVTVTVNTNSLCPSPALNAFTGCYYKDISFGTLGLTRQDNTINFDWGNGSPDPTIPADQFSVRWQGNFNFNAGSYTFTVTGDDGVRLYIDNILYIDKWLVQPATTYTYTQSALTSGNHLIKLEYYDNWGGAVAKLSWKQNNVPDTTAPSSPTNLSATAVSPSQINLSWSASTDNIGVTGYKVYRDGVRVGTASATTYSDTGLTQSSVHSYTVSAYDAVGNSSAQSTIISAIVQAGSTALNIGSRITTTANLNVRQSASITATKLGTQSVNALGTITTGPTSANGRAWWNINYDTGVDGWSVGDYLVLINPSLPAVGVSVPISHTLTVGWTGEEVSTLQTVLIKLNFYRDEITGYFGNLTRTAVMNFQTANALDAVGVVGPKTRALLLQMMGR